MSLRVAVQMDPMAGVNINGDSSFALMLAAQFIPFAAYAQTTQNNPPASSDDDVAARARSVLATLEGR